MFKIFETREEFTQFEILNYHISIPDPIKFTVPTSNVINPGLQERDECLSCPEGFYCQEGTSEPSLKCSAGYYCDGGATNVSFISTKKYLLLSNSDPKLSKFCSNVIHSQLTNSLVSSGDPQGLSSREVLSGTVRNSYSLSSRDV